jgi:hypothetical protein
MIRSHQGTCVDGHLLLLVTRIWWRRRLVLGGHVGWVWVVSRLHHLRIMLLLERWRRQVGRWDGLGDHCLGRAERNRVLRLVEVGGWRVCLRVVVWLLRKNVLVGRRHGGDHGRLVGDVFGGRRLLGGWARVYTWLVSAALMFRQCCFAAKTRQRDNI